jgi:hypothetical protein
MPRRRRERNPEPLDRPAPRLHLCHMAKPPPKAPADSREARLAAALRANLQRRKAQARAKAAAAAAPPAPPPAKP